MDQTLYRGYTCTLGGPHDLQFETAFPSFSLQVWAALLENMPMTAMIRNLGKMSSIGLLKPLSRHAQLVCSRLHEETLLRRARIHPFNVLVALKTYEQGKGDKGKLSWEVNQTIVQALDDAYYLSFKVGIPCCMGGYNLVH